MTGFTEHCSQFHLDFQSLTWEVRVVIDQGQSSIPCSPKSDVFQPVMVRPASPARAELLCRGLRLWMRVDELAVVQPTHSETGRA